MISLAKIIPLTYIDAEFLHKITLHAVFPAQMFSSLVSHFELRYEKEWNNKETNDNHYIVIHT